LTRKPNKYLEIRHLWYLVHVKIPAGTV